MGNTTDALDEDHDGQGCTKLLSQVAKEGKGGVSGQIKQREMLEKGRKSDHTSR